MESTAEQMQASAIFPVIIVDQPALANDKPAYKNVSLVVLKLETEERCLASCVFEICRALTISV
jgi:hypothetical protein